ncbi:MAG: transmembrane 220 family protein [Bacteroidota bacterium]
MRYISLFFFVIFLLFAYWQFNDPDPIWWVTIYLIAAFVSFRAFQNKYSPETLILLSVLYLAYASNSFLQITHYEGFFSEGGGLSMKSTNQELAREVSGLLICVFTFVIYSVYYFSKRDISKT